VRIVILGAGALGSLFGGLLSRKHEVVLVGRKPHTSAVRERGLKITGATRRTARVRAVESVEGLGAPDLLIVAVKAYDTESALREASGLVGPRTTVLSFQNGITTLGILEGLVPKGRLVAGWTSHGATLDGPGTVRHAGAGDTVVGELDGRASARVREISAALAACGIKSSVSTEVRREIWLKGLVNSAINPLTAIAGCENGAISSDPSLRRVAKAVCDEGAAVARAEGHAITGAEAFKRTMRVAEQTATNRSSMLRDLESGRRTEVDFLNGAICSLAARHGLCAPVNAALRGAISTLSGE
jgi:2-dehydropantoate 2-reductase